MCVHYEEDDDKQDLASFCVNEFGDVVVPDDLPPSQRHIWPKRTGCVLIQTDKGRAMAPMRWGVHVEIRGKTKPLIKFVQNARDDKLSGFPWRYSAAERRCLIPALSYFESDGPKGGTWPVRYTVNERRRFFIAGLWATDPDKVTRAYTMVTTSPNELAAQIHDRMPLLLDQESAREWIGHTPLPADRLAALCRPFPTSAMSCRALPVPDKKISKADLKSESETASLD